MKLTAEQQVWFDAQTNSPARVNPCVRLYGHGPADAKCKTCAFLFYHTTARRFWKCHLRIFTRGPASDHRVNWPACGKYEERKA
jgi:hypothetical protein